MYELNDKIVKSKYLPKFTNTVWIDTSDETPVLKVFINGKWVPISGSGGSTVDTKFYHAAGNATLGTLDFLDASHEGFVYNITLAFTTTSDFVEGSGEYYSAGTNVVVVNAGTVENPIYKYDVLGGGGAGFVSDLIIPLTRGDLLNLISNQELIPGMRYRITDYECITIQEGTDSANHLFDIIVLADSIDTLNENAFATQHSGDSYFDNSNLDAWRLKYCIYNDDSRFSWVSEKAGKGVIYYMRDEYGNEAPYDFKNILFYCEDVSSFSSAIIDSNSSTFGILENNLPGTFGIFGGNTQITCQYNKGVYSYTFDSKNSDLSITGACIGNTIKPVYILNNNNTPTNPSDFISGNITMTLNNIVIFSNFVYYNVFDDYCFDIRINGHDMIYCKFNSLCHSITVATYSIYNCNFGNNCRDIAIVNDNGYSSSDITLGNDNSNILFVNGIHIKTGNICSNIIVSENIQFVDVSDNVLDIYFLPPSDLNTFLENIKVLQGINNSANNHDIRTLILDTYTGDFQTIVSQDENGNIVHWMAKDGGYGGIPVETSLPQSGGILPNVLYKLGTLADNSSTIITLSSPTDASIANIYHLTFDTPDFGNDISSIGPSITWGIPVTIGWADGDAPTFLPNMYYEVSIMDNIACVVSSEKHTALVPEP